MSSMFTSDPCSVPVLPGKPISLYQRLLDVAMKIKTIAQIRPQDSRRAKRWSRHLSMANIHGMTDVIYQHHSRELLERIAHNQNLSDATRAEVFLHLHGESKTRLLNGVEARLYMRLMPEVANLPVFLTAPDDERDATDKAFHHLAVKLGNQWRHIARTNRKRSRVTVSTSA